MSEATNRLERGARFPYDAPDSWWNETGVMKADIQPATDWAHAAARGVIADLKDRRGIKQGFNDIDEDVRAELVTTIADIIREAHKQATNG